MKQINFSNPGGFPLEQETLEKLQTAYRSELYEAIKSHLSIVPDTNYIIAHAQSGKHGWAVIHENGEGILYPMSGDVKDYLKTTKTTTSLVYGDGNSQNAYTDYNGEYVSALGTPTTTDKETINYYDLDTFKTVKSIQAIEEILQSINNKIAAIEDDLETYLPLDGSKAMKGDLDLGIYHLSKLDTLETFAANVRAVDFKLGSIERRGKFHPDDYLGRALADSSTDTETSLTLNYDADWEKTHIGGKVYLKNLNTDINGSLLVLDGSNQVIKSNHLLDSLLERITKLEEQKSTAVPLGMIALWGKTDPFPDGWEEYVPLRGRMPIGLKPNDSTFDTLLSSGGSKTKTLTIDEIPSHFHHKPDSVFKSFAAGSGDYGNSSSTGTGTDGGDNSQLAIGNLGSDNYYDNGDALERAVGNDMPFSILNPYRVVQFIQYTGRSVDTTPPTNTINLMVTGHGRTFVALQWTPSFDDRDVTNYLIYKDGVLAATVDDVLSYSISGLSRNTSYEFYVIAQDAVGNKSEKSNTVRERTNLL